MVVRPSTNPIIVLVTSHAPLLTDQIQHNFFETSHVKGEQDAAGSCAKQKVSQAVLHRTATINSAKSMHQYLVQNFSQPTASSFISRTSSVQLKSCIFLCVSSEGDGAVNRKGMKESLR